MKIAEVERQALVYFGKDRSKLQNLLKQMVFNGTVYRSWKNRVRAFAPFPFDVSYGIFNDVADALIEKRYHDIDWNWLGDLSWTIRFVLNEGIDRVYDFDKRLAARCGGTVRVVEVYISEIIPTFTIDAYYMTYDRKQNFWEFGPLQLSDSERTFIERAKAFLKNLGYTFLSKRNALRKPVGLTSDVKEENASLFDALFVDTQNYTDGIKRFNDKMIVEKSGKESSWTEYYDKLHRLTFRHEYTYYPSGNVTLVVTDRYGAITEIKMWRDIGKVKHAEFSIDIISEHNRRRMKSHN